MRRALTVAGACALLAGCFGGGDPESSPSPADARARCDSYAAQAIQTQDLQQATALAAQASQCYAELRNQRPR